jgi:hypothetical protein
MSKQPVPIFLGRKQELAQYKEFLNNNYPWLLFIIAVGGTGKTALLSRMCEQTPQDVSIVRLDFTVTIKSRSAHFEEDESPRMPINPLKHLQLFVNELKRKNAIDLEAGRAFDKVVEEAREKFSKQITFNMQKIIADRASLKDTDMVIDVPGYRELQDSYRQQRDWVTPAFLDLMETFKPDHLVVMLDTCEWLHEPINFEVGDWLMYELLIPLRGNMGARGRQCHVVMAGTAEPPQIKVFESREPNSIDWLELGDLDKAAVIPYLQTIGMQNIDLCEQCYDMAYGNASCVSIICKLWQNLGKKSSSEDANLCQSLQEEPLNAESLLEFRQRFYEQAVKSFVENHILDAPIRTPLYELTRYGVLLRRFSQQLLEQVFCDILDELPPKQVPVYLVQFIEQLYVRKLGRFKYTLLELLREVLTDAIRMEEPVQWKHYHERARDIVPPTSDEWYYHVLAAKFFDDETRNEEQEKVFWRETLRDAEAQGKAVVDALVNAATDKTLAFTYVAREAQYYRQVRSS